MMVLGSCLLLASCAQNISPNTYTSGEVGVVSRVKTGVILAKRVIKIDNSNAMGGLAGATAGGALGTMAGGGAATSIAAGVGGAVVGGVALHAVDKAVNKHTGYEYMIKLDDNGQTIAVTQEQSVQLAAGQKVAIIYGAMTRIIPR